ncbi:Protein arginine N-methyltransferase 1.6 [Camellia lanceoleosa]|uniref:Protein arginine N-methyltransferase 1.6 n=1 Tax=Camellia lanceoleosa TaxID=1840588 RepID=A0ACC0FHI8_9ERIC|nr:Protein arginine N-methyltransferase 1.6 [Camellia lanceoleosa]
MLNDSPRNKAFREAIDKTVTKPCHVLDIGAGTGLLSMMAARAMDSGKSTTCSGSEGMVTACESYLLMVKLMRKVLHLNGMERKVRVINKRSDELEVGVDVTSRADVLVSEILDSELLGDGLIPTLQNAHDKLLVQNPQTVPTEQLLMARPESQGKAKLHIKATNDGTVHAVVSWWVLQLDCEGTIFYSTGPKWISFPFNKELQSSFPSSGDWCDHWKQCVYFSPGKGLSISKDEELHLHAIHTDISISYEFETQAEGTEIKQYDEFARDDQLILSPERVAIYGDSNWIYSLLEVIKKGQ